MPNKAAEKKKLVVEQPRGSEGGFVLGTQWAHGVLFTLAKVAQRKTTMERLFFPEQKRGFILSSQKINVVFQSEKRGEMDQSLCQFIIPTTVFHYR